ncbi:hypothetical protein MIND_00844800 [Mycena indigotica]|uniref:AN1-type domain-containing protein n=1 Tax=Mycena indigotica TaxID=2126181 RepID=A0A8H6VYZ4_9AGAR|nr:uncharacterized protein MIND_00844800 [Mycena indigotica]KAF7298967.1 hypothetical protein MIND_00844800 [Mycena indigotica]
MDHDDQMLSVGKQCGHQSCMLVDFLPFQCLHCQTSFCQEHFKVAAHNCPKYDAAKYNRVSPNCPLCNTVVSVRAGQDANEAVETHFLTDCSVMTGKVRAKAPVCARARCGKTLFAPIRCTKCNQQFCPAHRFPADHTCAPVLTASKQGGLTAGSRLLDLNTKASALNSKASAAGAKTVGAIKAAASAAQTSVARQAGPSTTSSSSNKKPIPVPAVFSKTDRALLPPPTKFEIQSSPEPVIRPLAKSSFVPPPIFASA